MFTVRSIKADITKGGRDMEITRERLVLSWTRKLQIALDKSEAEFKFQRNFMVDELDYEEAEEVYSKLIRD